MMNENICCETTRPIELLLSGNIRRLRPFGSVDDVESYFLTFCKSLESLLDDCRVVYEDIFAFRSLDEAVALGIIEPLHFTRWHNRTSSLRVEPAESSRPDKY